MSNKGRKKKPANLHVLQGTYRADRHNKNAPSPDKELPRAPHWLSKKGCEIFGILATRIDRMGYASSSHTEMLGLAAMRLAEVDDLSELIDGSGYVYKTTSTSGDVIHKARPEVKLRDQAAKHAQSLLAEFGLSAAAVGKITKPEKEKENDQWGQFG